MDYQTGTDAKVVLVIIDSVVEGGDEIVGVYQAEGESAGSVEVDAAADIGGKGGAGVGDR